jgi:4,4'-diaponeurosporenoate glycosyltransferase
MFYTLTALISLLGSALFQRRLTLLRLARAECSGDAARVGQVSIIVPARNEEQNLPTLLGSIAALSPAPLEVIVVDDHSSDRTAAIAHSFGARVVTPEPLAPGFIGKTWACLAGASVARGEYLLFTDADTWHAPDSLRRMLAHLLGTNAGLASIVPTHRLESTWEHLQGVFQLLLLLATRASSADPPARDERRYANGQYLLFRRQAYEAVGGHRAVAPYIAEDLAFARKVSSVGFATSVLFAPNAVLVRMYPEGLGAFIRGWRRNFREGMRAGGVRAIVEMTALMAWLIGVPLCLLDALVRGRWDAAAAWLFAYLISAALVAREQRHYGSFRAVSALSYPLFSLLFAWVSLLSAVDALRGAPVLWRGRAIDVAR